jgi:hypothetical protein
MRLLARAFTLAALLLTAAGATGAAAQRSGGPCSGGACRILLADAQAQVLQVRKADREGVTRYSDTFVRWLSSRRTTPLGDRYLQGMPASSLSHLSLNGRFAAYVLASTLGYNDEGSTLKIMRIDAKTGRREMAQLPAVEGEGKSTVTTPCDGGVSEASPGVTDLHVTAAGTVEWILGSTPDHTYLPGPPEPVSYQVCALAGASLTPVLLASSTRIEPHSLAATSGYVYWSEGGVTRSRALPHYAHTQLR